MVTLPSGDGPGPPSEPHRHREAAESFGADPHRYDRARPRYPDALVARIAAACPGGHVLDVGVGTGIAARQFQAAGCTVLGVDVDARMAGFARRAGTETEVAAFEEWDPAGRTFDAVVAGQTWHWVDPVAGAAKAAAVLRPGGLLAVFWNAHQPPPGLAARFATVTRRVLPDSPAARLPAGGVRDAYTAMCATAADGIRRAAAFEAPRQWTHEWRRTYTRDEWLDQLPTHGGNSRVPADRLARLLEETGAAVDAWGGAFTMRYTTVAVAAVRTAP